MKTIKIFPIDGDLKLIPTKATEGSAALDIRSAESFAIFPGDTHLTRTGIILDMPENVFAFVLPRSGLSSKYGLRLANCVGLIDSDYKKELFVSLYRDHVGQSNLFEDSTEALKQIDVKKYDRIAQIMFFSQEKFDIEILEEFTLSNKKHHGSGFGSTGTK
jgi:dUTP pyrophosphatase